MPHPMNCRSYRRRSALLHATVRSMLRQTDPDVRVVVVANESPGVEHLADPRVAVVLVDFPPSASPPGQPTATWAIYEDKGAKLAVGVARAIREPVSHV